MVKRYNHILLVSGIMLSCLVVIAVFSVQRQQARALAELGAHAIADRSIAEDIYYETEIRPKVTELLTQKLSESTFDPALLSGTYINRNEENIYQYISTEIYRIRSFANNARTPEHESSEEESEFLSRLNSSPNLIIEVTEIEISGKPYILLKHRGAVQEKSCQKCHDTPENAPKGLVDLYGKEKGFNRRVGEIVSGLAVTVSLEPFYHRANHFALVLSSILVGVITTLILIIYKLNTKLLFKQK